MANTAVNIQGATTIVGYTVTPPFVTTDVFTFSFPYLDQADFEIEVQSETILDSADYEFTSDYLIQLTSTGVTKLQALYGSLATVSMTIRRRTQVDTRLVDYKDGATLTEADLDLQANQVFYLIQEIYDTSELGNIQFNPVDGAIDIDGAELSDVAEPTIGSSAATLTTVLNNAITPDYTEGDTYKTGRLVFESGNLYRVNTDVTDAPAVFDSGDFDLVIDASSLSSIATIAADVITAQNTANTAQSTANSAQADATQGINDAAAAQSTAASAQADATQAISDAEAAQTTADTNTSNLTSHEAENETAHTERDTKANLDTWAISATNGALAFATDTDVLYIVKDAALVEVGSGAGGSGSLSTFHTETFETTVAGDASTGNNTAFLGGGLLVGTNSDETTNPLSGDSAFKYTQASGSGDDYSAFPAFDVAIKNRGQLASAKFSSKYDGNNSDIQFVVYDVTNAAVITTIDIKASTLRESHEVFFIVPDTCTSMRYGVHTVVENIGSILILDDIEFNVDPLSPTDIFDSEEKTDWTPSFDAAFGTVTVEHAFYKRLGSRLFFAMKFITGTTTAAVGGITLPNSWTADTAAQNSIVGKAYRTAVAVDEELTVIAQNNSNKMYIGYQNGSNGNASTASVNVSSMLGSATDVYLYGSVDINEKDDFRKGVVVKNLESSNISNSNSFKATISNNGTATVSDESHEGFFTVTRNSQGVVQVDMPSGVFVDALPHITLTVSAQAGTAYAGTRSAEYYDVTNNQFFVATKFSDASSNNIIDYDFTIEVSKQAPDYVTESEKVYTVPIGFKESEDYNTSGLQTNFWDNTGAALTWDESLITNLSSSETISVSDGTTPSGTATKIIAKQDIDIFVQVAGNVNSGNGIFVINSTGNRLNYVIRSDGYNNYTTSTAMVKLSKGDYLYFFNSSAVNREGLVSIWAKPSKEEGLWLGNFGQPSCFYKTSASVSYSSKAGNLAFQQHDIVNQNGDNGFSVVDTNEITLSAGSYDFEVPVGANGNTEYVDFEIYDGSSQLFLATEAVYNTTGDAIVFRTIMGRLKLNSSTTIQLRTKSDLGSGAMYIGDFKITKVR